MQFKDMLKYYRTKKGLSQRDLAKQLGISPSTVGMYESGKREPDFETEEHIADFFNVDLNTLRGRDIESPDTEKALQLYELYKNAIPQVQEAVDVLLKQTQSSCPAPAGKRLKKE